MELTVNRDENRTESPPNNSFGVFHCRKL